MISPLMLHICAKLTQSACACEYANAPIPVSFAFFAIVRSYFLKFLVRLCL
jgi:hypothetical protein